MKLIRWLSLCLVVQVALLGGARAAAADAGSAYHEAVKAYVAAVDSELRALRIQADEVFKVAAPEKQDEFKGFYAKLEQCELTSKELKAVPAKDFDKTKALYEKQRQEAMKAWEKLTVPAK